jgi:hypothetical protein
MATNGLDRKEIARLMRQLTILDRVLEKGFLLGGGDVAELKSLADRIRTRLNPPTPNELENEYDRLITLHGSIEHVQAALKGAA